MAIRVLLAIATLIILALLILLIKRRVSIMAERYQQTPGRFPSTRGILMFLLPLPVLFAAIAALAHGNLAGLFSTHPKTEERVARLMAMASSAR